MDIASGLGIARQLSEAARRRLARQRQLGLPLSYSQQPAPAVPWYIALPDASPLVHEDAPRLPATEMNIYDWLIRQGGVDLSGAHYKISLYNPGPNSLRINRIGADVLHRQPALHAAEAGMPSAGAGAAIILHYDLDEPTPVAHEATVDGSMSIKEHRWGDRGEYINIDQEEAVEILMIAKTSWRVDWTPTFDGHLNDRNLTKFRFQGSMYESPIATTGRCNSAEPWICPSVAGPRFQTRKQALGY